MVDVARNITVIRSPCAAQTMIMVQARFSRECRLRDDLSPIISHAERGIPSFITSTMMPMYVYTSVVTTSLELNLATHSLLRVL